MTLHRSYLSMAILLLFANFGLVSAPEMSIISYDEHHGEKSLSNSRTGDEVMTIYESWLVKHSKVYNALEEKEKRFQIFKDNLRFIDNHNNAGEKSTYTLGLNRFADLTNEEYRSKYLGVKPGSKRILSRTKVICDRYTPKVGESLPDSVDWRTKGTVGPIKDQGSCAIDAVEGINQIVTGDMIPLSEQELVDCDTSYNEGCNGGLKDYAFQFIIDNGGIDSEEDYPYKGRDDRCDQYRKNAKFVAIDGYEDVTPNSKKALKKAVANQPISVAIEAGGRAFQGIFPAACGTALDHGVIAVGNGSENGKDYWIVRNSWGADWGEAGYLRMEHNLHDTDTGKCGIAIEPSYPVKTGQNPPNPSPSPVEQGLAKWYLPNEQGQPIGSEGNEAHSC